MNWKEMRRFFENEQTITVISYWKKSLTLSDYLETLTKWKLAEKSRPICIKRSNILGYLGLLRTRDEIFSTRPRTKKFYKSSGLSKVDWVIQFSPRTNHNCLKQWEQCIKPPKQDNRVIKQDWKSAIEDYTKAWCCIASPFAVAMCN